MKDGLINLILYITAAIDSGENDSISLDKIKQAVDERKIFEFIKTNINSPRKFDEKIFKNHEKEHLELYWQDHLLDWDFENKFGVNRNPLCVLLALVAISIQ